ncbi:hypothetical protein FP2506_10271 [Fulvimarina pelagi HTCC2506]|uniref:Uncharacterized protein n=1 Tax=Fulvimarina pelagi HTCC2506 TaxID=314231 RepID=Q0G542_9HYPH|nr:hypothetical protein [Fulvimarina pelagi]EAU43222.1 hypothetical protein FP2506_10271 [Fulvimarina pelagi HTCC2506]
MLDRGRLVEALTLLGADLSRRGLLVELAVYGGSALILQFDWRRMTQDVDALVRAGHGEGKLASSVAAVAQEMGLQPDWLNDAVGMFTPLEEPDDLFEFSGNYPIGEQPGLRVLVAKPRYMLAMKLAALKSLDRGERDLDDARELALHLDIRTEDELLGLYSAIHDEEPPYEITSRLPQVLGG